VPGGWKNPSNAEVCREPISCWWKVFHDCTLNELEELALENNHDIYAALDRVAQARALTGVVGSALYPDLYLNGVYHNEGRLARLFGRGDLKREHRLENALPLVLNWEIDLWGQLRSDYESSVYSAQAQEEALQGVLLLVTAELAHCYFRARTLDAQIDLYLHTIGTRKKALEINQSRYEAKMANYADVSRAALELTNVEADYCNAMRQRNIEENRIAVLVGIPASEFYLAHAPLVAEPPLIPSGLPSDIILRRPDIAEAEREMASQHAEVRAAYASFFPKLSLTGVLGFLSPQLDRFLKWGSRLYAFGADVSQSAFVGGENVSNLDLAWAEFREADQVYQQTVLIAFQEVEDALSAIEWLYRETEKLHASADSAQITYKIAKDCYYHGVTFYLDVVNSERDALNSQRILNHVQGRRYGATIDLIKALGGSWSHAEDG
jgi:multidrug efflux system outer membrane protein